MNKSNQNETQSSAKLKQDIVLARKGDADAFGRLYELYADEMYRYALWYLGMRELAEDAVSDAVCSAFVSIGSLKNPGAFKPWLFRILSNSCKACLTDKIQARSHTVLEQAEQDCAAEAPVESTELWEAVRQLEPLDRELLLLTVIAGYTSSEVGKIMSMPAGTIRSRVSRAADKLRAILGDSKSEIPATAL